MDKLISRIFDVKLIYELFYGASGNEKQGVNDYRG
jgi:hypothetical protein